MSTFTFKAMDLTGVKSGGEIEAESKQVVTDQLRERGLIVLDIVEKGRGNLNIELFERVKLTDVAIFTRQLATMISSGMTILRALYVLEEQTESKKLSEAIVKVRLDVEAGLALSDALQRHPKIFNELFVAMARAGETGGVLENALLRTADQLEGEASLRRQVKSAMVYPAVVITVAFGVLFGLVTFLVPVFVNTFKQFGGKLPSITQFTVNLSKLFTGYWWLMILLAVGLVYALRRWKASDGGRRQWDRLRLKTPMKIGDIVQKIAIARWSRTFATLVAAGVPLLQAVEITGKTAGNTVVDEAMQDVLASIKGGGTISEPLRRAPIFPTMVGHMVGVGEETGELDTMLNKIAEFYEDQVDAAVKALTSILEPVMIVVVGGMVGFIVISMYLPLFKVYDQIK